MSKTLKLKYGEYYSLKITDSSKNIINNVEFTASKITSDQEIFTEKTYAASDENSSEVSAEKKAHIEELKKGARGMWPKQVWDELSQEEKNKHKDEKAAAESEFYSWYYEEVTGDRKKAFDGITNLLGTGKLINHKGDKEVSKHDVKCEFQILERVQKTKTIIKPKFAWVPVKVLWFTVYVYRQTGYTYETRTTGEVEETYRWTDEFTIPVIKKEDLKFLRYDIKINQQHLKRFLNRNSTYRECLVLNWRYKVTGGVIKIEKLAKEIYLDDNSYNLRGKHSYAYPESTLMEDEAKVVETDAKGRVTNASLSSHISNHVLKNYKDGRETFDMTWQGDPAMTIGDRIVLEDKFGIEKEYMITGNQFVLENNGKFFMRTEGISVI